ncbi:hypothetical protein ACEPAI_40 [Sanghuangporus weigelae]
MRLLPFPRSSVRARAQAQSRSSLPSLLCIPFLLISLLTSTVFVLAQNGPTDWTSSPFNAPALPLAVKSPYLNTWLQQGNRPASLDTSWPNLWTIAAITGWYSSVVVDGTAYRIMGAAPIANVSNANQTAIEFTATRTSFIFNAGPMQINCSFISPIEPTDLVRQSLPFSYYTMSASSLDGNSHQLRMYSDISGEFIAGDTSALAIWNSDDEGQYIVLSMQLQTPQKYTEVGNHAQDAVEYYAFKKISGATASWAITEDVANRGRAANMSSLGNQQDNPPRGVEVRWPTLGIAVDWQSIQSTSEPAVWAIGVMRSPAIQYRTPAGSNQEHFPYFLTQWSDGPTATKAFLDDFDRAIAASSAFDVQISAAGNAVSQEYADLLALSTRQVMGTLDITLSRTGGGEWNFTDTKAFMKNIGSAGSDASSTGLTITSVNTVDTLYAALPMFLYLNPEIAGYLLAPLLEYQDSSEYTQSYAARNIGSSYPNATADGITDSHDYRIEESANMLIMTLAYSQRSGNGTFLSRHYTLLRGWAEYLENNTMSPTNEKSADFTTSSQVSNNNQTNLVLKGIIGIACMTKIAELADVSGDQQHFNDTATSYISEWQANALASDNSHINFISGDTDTNGLIYNLYADQLLQLDLVSDQVYQVATVFYNNIASQATYGLPLNNEDTDRTGAHWMMFSASTVQNFATREYMINQVHEYAASNQNNTPFSLYYDPSSGIVDSSPNAGKNSPAIGGVFSLLALNTTIQSDINIPRDGSTIPDGSEFSASSRSNAGAIAGGVVGGLAGAALIGAGVFFCLRRRRHLREQQIYDTRVNPMSSGALTSPSSYDRRPKLPGFSDGATFEPFTLGTTPTGTATGTGTGSDSQRYGAITYAGVGATGAGTAAYTHSNGAEPVLPDPYGASTAQNVRDSTYFRTHRPGESDDIGPSASQVGSATTSSGRGSSRGGRGSHSSRSRGGGHGGGSVSDGTAPQQVMLAKQTLVNEELRSEVDNLRRDLERIREERLAAMHDEAPPEYDGPS